MVDVGLEVRARVGDSGWQTLADGCLSGDSTAGVMAAIASSLRDLADTIDARLQVVRTPSWTAARLDGLEKRLILEESDRG